MNKEATLFGETEIDRYNRLLKLEESIGDDVRKEVSDETAGTFMPNEEELIKLFLK